jgi:hypothetical protein
MSQGGPVEISQITCDEFCVAERNRQRLKTTYETKLNEYKTLYRAYINDLFNRNADGTPRAAGEAATSQIAAESKHTQLVSLNGQLDNVLIQLNQALTTSQNNIKERTASLANNNRSLLQDNLLISQIGGSVASRYNELKSKEKQIEYNKSKNNYKKRIMWFLIMANMIVLAVLAFLFIRSNGGLGTSTPSTGGNVSVNTGGST